MARQFNGSNEYLQATSAVADGPPIAMSCWFIANSSESDGNLLSISSSSQPSRFYRLALIAADEELEVESRLVAHVCDDSFESLAVSSNEYVVGVWHHAFCVFYSNTYRQIWLDGVVYFATDSVAPSGMDRTQVGGLNDGGSQSSFDGVIADAAIWSGSGVESMGDNEARQLSKGLSPLLLGKFAARLSLYQDLIRPINRPGVGIVLTAAGSPSVVPHPRSVQPIRQQAGQFPAYEFIAPFHAGAGAADGSRLLIGSAATLGSELGSAQPVGEVSS